MLNIFFTISIILICIQIFCSVSLYRIKKYELEVGDDTMFRLSNGEAFCGIIGWVMLAMVAIEATSDEPIFSFEDEYEIRN